MDPLIVSRCEGVLGQAEYMAALDNRHNIQRTSSTILSICPPSSIVAAILSLVSVALTIHAINANRLPSRKYTVLCSRMLGDTFSCLLIFFASLLSSPSSASFAIVALFLYISTFGFVQLSLSHLLFIILRQMSMSRPQFFSSVLSLRRLLFIIALIWIVSILYAAAFAPLTSLVLSPSNCANTCAYSSCQQPLLIVCLCLLSFLLLSVIFAYLAVLLKLYTTHRLETERAERESSKRQLLRFLCYGAHILLFITISTLLIVGVSVVLHNVWLFEQIRRDTESCQLVEYLAVAVRLEAISGGAILLWIVRVIADIAILFLRDYRKLIPCIARRDENRTRLVHQSRRSSAADNLHIRRRGINFPVFVLDGQSARNNMKN